MADQFQHRRDEVQQQSPNGQNGPGAGHGHKTGSNGHGRTRGRRRGDKRAQIIEAAIEVFAQKGFQHARISDIARQAGVADGTIYIYFDNKDDILLSLFEDKISEMLNALDEQLEGIDDPFDRIRTFSRFHFQQVKENPRLAEVLQVELRLSSKFLKEYRPIKLWAYIGRLQEALHSAKLMGMVRDEVDPFVGMWSFFGAIDELAMQWVLARRKERFNLDKAGHVMAEVFIRGVAV